MFCGISATYHAHARRLKASECIRVHSEKQKNLLIFFIVKMTYFKIIHHSELPDHDAVKVIGQKLYDHPFRTYVHFKPNRVKLLQGILGTECKIQKIPLKILKIEIEGLN